MKLPYRLRHNFRLSILTLLCACALFGITPFAIWRFMTGNWIAGVVDLGILLSVVGAAAYAWRTDDTTRAGFVLAHVTCSGAVAAAFVLGDVGLFWVYPAIITCYFITSAGVALYCMVLSLLVLILHGGPFDSTEQMLSFIATVIVVTACAYVFALRHERQRQELEQLAHVDSLTGVPNRRAMDQELQAAVALQTARGINYGLVVTDLDHFKRINDQYGHSAGDAILLKFARLLDMNTRGTDKVFRFGGEEFVILFEGVAPAQLCQAVTQLQGKLREALSGLGHPVTASFGTACLRSGESQSEWFARADEALYRAKENGRDRIESGDFTPQRQEEHLPPCAGD